MQAMAVPPGRGLAAVLAVMVHLLFFALLVYSLNWKNHAPEPVMVELWQPASVMPAAQNTPPEKKVKTLPIQPQPVMPDPDIALAEQKRKLVEQQTQQTEQLQQQQLQQQKRQAQIALQQAQAQLAQQQRLQQQLASQLAEQKLAQEKSAEQQKLAQQQKQQKQQAALRKMIAQQTQAALQSESANALNSNRQAALASKQSAQQAKLSNEYVEKIKAKIRSQIILPAGLQANPLAIFEVLVLPTGDVVQVKLIHPSGQPAYDDAVDRAILKASPLPMPPDPALVGEFRDLTLNFSPAEN